jgi:hypothetical protein
MVTGFGRHKIVARELSVAQPTRRFNIGDGVIFRLFFTWKTAQ